MNNLKKDSLVEFIIKEKLERDIENIKTLDSINKYKDSVSIQVVKIKPQPNFKRKWRTI